MFRPILCFVFTLFCPLALAEESSSSYHGGLGYDWAQAVAVAGNGDIVAAGFTSSLDLPTTAGAFSRTHSGEEDAWIARFSRDGHTLLAATYFGGPYNERISGLAVDPASGDILVVGVTRSPGLPGTAGAAQANHGGGTCPSSIGDRPCADAFVARFNGNLTHLRRLTYLGGSGYDSGFAIALRGDGGIVIAGQSDGSLPGTAGAAQPNRAGQSDGFVARFSADLGTLVRTTFQGGSAADDLVSLWIDPASGDIVAAGATQSPDLADTAGGLQPTHAGNYDVQLARFDDALTTRRQASYFGSAGDDVCNGLIFDAPTGGLLVVGTSTSTTLPGLVAGTAPNAGDYDAFVSRVGSNLRTQWRTRMVGGAAFDGFSGGAVMANGTIVLAGMTRSAAVPSIIGSANGGSDTLLTYVPNDLLGPVRGHRWGGSNDDSWTGASAVGTDRICVAGWASGGIPMRRTAAQPQPRGGGDAVYLCVDGAALSRIFGSGFENE